MTRFKLRDYQEVGVKHLLAHKRCLLCDSPGLGKTCQSMEAIRCIGFDKVNTLVICPASLILMWKRAIEDWFGSECEVYEANKTGGVNFTKRYRFILCSYNYLQKPMNVGRLLKLKWTVIVSDEAHAIKSLKTRQTKGFFKLVEEHTGFVWMLTGTPATRSGLDYYPYILVVRLHIGRWKNIFSFGEEFCDKQMNWSTRKPEYKGVKKNKWGELNKLLSKMMLRRKKEDVAKELPPKIFTDIPVRVDPAIVAESLALDEETVKRALETGVFPAHFQTVLNAIGMGKVDAAVEFIENCGEPIVIFTTHTDVVEALMEKFGDRAIKLTGADSRIAKDIAVKRFQTGEVDIFIANIIAGGTGITLHRSSLVLMCEISWSPSVELQAIDRVHRIGQTAETVNVVRLVAAGTIDEEILKVLEYKQEFISGVMGDNIQREK